MVGMRNRLVHDYGRIDQDVLSDTVIEDIPGSIAVLERFVRPEPPREANTTHTSAVAPSKSYLRRLMRN